MYPGTSYNFNVTTGRVLKSLFVLIDGFLQRNVGEQRQC